MNGGHLPDTDHVIRYIKPTAIDSGVVDGEGFELKHGHKGVSVNWLEKFEGDKHDQIAEVRRRKRLDWKLSGRLAELNIGKTRRHLLDEEADISFVEDPLDKDGEFDADPSHCLICGIPHDPPERKQALQDMIAETIVALHPANS